MPPRPPARLLSLAALAALGAVVSGCSASASVSIGTSELSAAKMRSLVSSITTRQGLTAQSVSCPSGVPLKAGKVSYCTAHYAGGETASFLVRQTDGNGDVDVHPAGMTVPAVENSIREAVLSKRGVAVVAKCPAQVPIVVGSTFVCTLHDRTQTVSLPVKITDADGGYVLGTTTTG